MRREAALSGDVDSFRRHLLVSVLQVLSAVARCMECDVAVTETDLEDMVMVELPDIHGKVQFEHLKMLMSGTCVAG